MSGGDFISRSEAQVCNRRRIEDRVSVIRDLRRVVKHLGLAAGDQLGLAAGDLERIEARKMAISPALLTAMYGAGGAKLLPALAPRDALDAGVAKIMAAVQRPVAPCAAAVVTNPTYRAEISSAPVHKAPVTPPLPPKLPPKPLVGTRDAEAHERDVLAGVGTTRADLVAILRRARDAYGNWGAAAAVLDIGKSTASNLAGNHSKFSERTAKILLAWDAANPVTGEDAVRVLNSVGDSADRAEGQQVPPPAQDAGTVGDTAVADREGASAATAPPPEQDSTAAPPVAPHPPEAETAAPCAAVDGAAASLPSPSPPLSGDPMLRALAEVQAGIDAALAEKARVDAEIAAVDAQIAALSETMQSLRAEREKANREFDRFFEAKDRLRDLVAA